MITEYIAKDSPKDAYRRPSAYEHLFELMIPLKHNAGYLRVLMGNETREMLMRQLEQMGPAVEVVGHGASQNDNQTPPR